MKNLELKLMKRYLLRESFYSFFVESFYYLNPGKTLKENWHMKYLSYLLEEVVEGKCKNLIICIPPRSLKSTMISVAFCAWIMGRNPAIRVMCASYAQKLSTKLSIDCRNLMNSQMYKDTFPEFNFAKDQNTKNKFSTSKGGYRIASSFAGSVIGEGGDILICDDPMSPAQAYSRLTRDKVYDWYMESFSTRLDDKKTGVKIIVMQRLHDDDLVGRIEREMGGLWKIISIPAIATHDQEFKIKDFRKIMNIGELLNADQEGKKELDGMRSSLGELAFAAQYLQKPIPGNGNVIKKEWLQYYEEDLKNEDFIVQSWDLGFTLGGDYSVCTTWMVSRDGKAYLIDVTRLRKEFTDLIIDFKRLYEKWNSRCVIIEDTVASKSFIQNVKQNTNCSVICNRPRADKLTRLMLVSPIFESGKVFFPKKAPWLSELLYELLSFPQCRNDDQVDSISQFLEYFARIGSARSLNRIAVL